MLPVLPVESSWSRTFALTPRTVLVPVTDVVDIPEIPAAPVSVDAYVMNHLLPVLLGK